MQHLNEGLYITLRGKAFDIVSGMVKRVGVAEWKEMAHDITVDFLFFSRSYRETFDNTRCLQPFFNSYVRRKCRGIVERKGIEMKRGLSLDKLPLLDQSDHVLDYEVHSVLQAHAEFLKDKWYWSNKYPVNFRKLFELNLVSNVYFGETNTTWLAEQLLCPVGIVRKALERMREMLKERMENEKQNFYWVSGGLAS